MRIYLCAMEKGTRNFLVVGLVAVAFWYFSKQSTRFDIGGPSLSKLALEGSGIRINVKIPILNRSDIAGEVQGFLGQLYYGANALGVIQLRQPTPVPARSSSNPEFTMLLNYGSLGLELVSVLSNLLGIELPGGSPPDPNTPKVDITKFRIQGTLYLSGLSVDINESLFPA